MGCSLGFDVDLKSVAQRLLDNVHTVIDSDDEDGMEKLSEVVREAIESLEGLNGEIQEASKWVNKQGERQ